MSGTPTAEELWNEVTKRIGMGKCSADIFRDLAQRLATALAEKAAAEKARDFYSVKNAEARELLAHEEQQYYREACEHDATRQRAEAAEAGFRVSEEDVDRIALERDRALDRAEAAEAKFVGQRSRAVDAEAKLAAAQEREAWWRELWAGDCLDEKGSRRTQELLRRLGLDAEREGEK